MGRDDENATRQRIRHVDDAEKPASTSLADGYPRTLVTGSILTWPGELLERVLLRVGESPGDELAIDGIGDLAAPVAVDHLGGERATEPGVALVAI